MWKVHLWPTLKAEAITINIKRDKVTVDGRQLASAAMKLGGILAPILGAL
jgi:hypothetical protein